jgi:hypothetical protein
MCRIRFVFLEEDYRVSASLTVAPKPGEFGGGQCHPNLIGLLSHTFKND